MFKVGDCIRLTRVPAGHEAEVMAGDAAIVENVTPTTMTLVWIRTGLRDSGYYQDYPGWEKVDV